MTLVAVSNGTAHIQPSKDDIYLTTGRPDGQGGYVITFNEIDYELPHEIGLVIRSSSSGGVQVFSKNDANAIWAALYPNAKPPY
jgi:hypothetical protein